MVMVCEDCRFFQPEAGDEVDIGQCRRRAPLARLVEPGSACEESPASTAVVWPVVEVCDWCGEFEPKAEGRGHGA